MDSLPTLPDDAAIIRDEVPGGGAGIAETMIVEPSMAARAPFGP